MHIAYSGTRPLWLNRLYPHLSPQTLVLGGTTADKNLFVGLFRLFAVHLATQQLLVMVLCSAISQKCR